MNFPITVNNFSLSSAAFYILNLHSKLKRNIILFTETREIGDNLCNIFRNFHKDIKIKFFNISKFFPESKILKNKTYIPEILELLYSLLLEKFDIFILPISLTLKKYIHPNILSKQSLNIKLNDELDRDALIEQLIEWGYERESFVSFKGEFSVRGDIIDIFCPLYTQPLRLTFFGDIIEQINFFNPETQRKDKNIINSIDIISCTEVIIKENFNNEDYKIMPGLFNEKTSSLFNYISDNFIKITYTKEGIFENLYSYYLDLMEHFKSLDLEYNKIFFDFKDIKKSINLFDVFFANFNTEYDKNIINLNTKSFDKLYLKIKNNPDYLINLIQSYNLTSIKTCFYFSDEKKKSFIQDLLKNNNLDFTNKNFNSILSFYNSHNQISFFSGNYFKGFYSDYLKIAVLNEKDLFGRKLKKINHNFDINLQIKNFSEIKEGDYIVHLQHGIGIFKGLKNLKFNNFKKDFFIIEYAGGDKLYVPIDKTNLLQKYIGKEGYVPVIDKLGSTKWQKTKEKVIKATELIAKDILELYAKRKLLKGISFKCDDSLIDEFSYNWEYEETDDQLKAINEIFNDMENDTPMDRLLCGDVGFGKTEVAIRAILKAVLSGYQVAFLVPTTILALQHYNVLKKRFNNFPFIIKKISRFESKKEQKEIIEHLKSGKIDIIIGTHRLLQDDISFKNLGLLIIDEEHKFGVKHKEKIKLLKSNIDVLYMTATPIPRTLQMSLVGLKDLSIIQTPPADRKEIETKIIKFDKNLIKNAIMKEINRNGQVFFVHNSIKSIYSIAKFLKELIPDAKITVAHAQMNERDLEKTIKDFIDKKYNILVCTTIIESGLDIPDVNTIIINRADRFGLSQLYQLRGRVGRSNIKAYAYLIIPHEENLNKNAIKRLRILQQYSNLSQGIKIALNDLELRGAGNFFGKEQSGKILSVGYEFFLETLEKTIKKLKGIKIEESIEPEIKVNFSFYIPDTYISDEKERFYYYKKLASIDNFTHLNEIIDELQDRFGQIPDEVNNLFNVISFKILLKKYKIKKATFNNNFVILYIDNSTNISIDKVLNLVNDKKAEIVSHETLKIKFKSSEPKKQIEELKNTLNEISKN